MTLKPSALERDDVRRLQGEGWTDREIHDAAQVAAYFNYINRLAEALGVDLEHDMKPPGTGAGS